MSETFGSLRYRLSKLPAGAGVDLEVLSGFLNDRLERLCKAYPYTRLNKQGFIQTFAPYQTGTVSIALGAQAGTGTLTVFTAAMTGWHYRIANLIEWYTFTYLSPTSFTIDRPYEGQTDAVNVGFTLWQPLYEMPPDLAEIYSLENITLGLDLEEQTREWLQRTDPARLNNLQPPTAWVPAEDSASGRPQIELWPGPNQAIGLPLDYRAKAPAMASVDDTETVIPDWVSVACLHAGVLADLYRLAGDQQRAQSEEQNFMMLKRDMEQDDARKHPVQKAQIADRYTQHRRDRVAGTRGRGRYRNWRPAGSL